MGANPKHVSLALVVAAAIALLLIAFYLLRSEQAAPTPTASSAEGTGREGESPSATATSDSAPGTESARGEGAPRPGAAAAESAPEGAPGRVSVVGGSGEPRVPPPHREGPYTVRRYPDGGLAEAPRGRLEATVIRDVVREHLDQLRFCFEWQLHAHPELGGRVGMEFRIAEDGTVEDAQIGDDTLGDTTVTDCFRGVVSRMRFPEPEGGVVTVRYPFVLSADGDPDERTPAAESPTPSAP